MNPLVLVILSVSIDTPVGPWSAIALGDEKHGATVQHPQYARVEFSLDQATGTWVTRVIPLGGVPVVVKVDAAWKPTGELAGPTRIVEATDLGNAARVIMRDGGVITGMRIDAASPEAFFRDKFALPLAPGRTVEVLAAIEPCAAEDLNGDGAVSAPDIAITLGAWGATSLVADINRDGIVDARDLAEILASFGSAGPSPGEPKAPAPAPPPGPLVGQEI